MQVNDMENLNPATLYVQEGMPRVLFILVYEKGRGELILTAPGERRIDKKTNEKNIRYVDMPNRKTAFIEIERPQPGKWIASIPHPEKIGNFEIKIDVPYFDTRFHLNAVQKGKGIISIAWNHKEMYEYATITFFSDTEFGTYRGRQISPELKAKAENQLWEWETRDVPSGDYYIYATLDNGEPHPEQKYIDCPFTIDNPNSRMVWPEFNTGKK